MSKRQLVFIVTIILLCGTQAQATWSVVLTDSATGEVALGTVTCLTDFDLLEILPVVVVGKGAAACQAFGDFDGQRRPILFEQLGLQTDPDTMLTLVAAISGHQSRQYGIADTLGRTATFTGTTVLSQLPWAGGVTGAAGTLHYAIQGNVVAGACVVSDMEQAVLNTVGDIPAKLMAAMEAARAAGGDGRCSCTVNDADACGCPPAAFTKSGHIGGLIVARVGDTDDPVCNASGCADGDYFMRLNVAGQSSGSPDPVLQLQQQFDAWRAGLIGRPDAGISQVSFGPVSNRSMTMTVTLRDWQGLPITASIESVTVEHAVGSAGIAAIGPASDQGGGVYAVALSVDALGTDRFVVTVDDGIRPVVLIPNPAITYEDLGVPASSTGSTAVLILGLVAAAAWMLGRRKKASG